MALLLVLLLSSSTLGLNFTVSGLGAGGFFASQLHIAYSNSVTGVGIIGGGPYYCSMASSVRAFTACKVNSYLVSLPAQLQYLINAATADDIDDITSISNDRAFIFSGSQDSRIIPSVVNLTDTFYRTFIHNNYKISSVYNIPAGHAWVSDTYGGPCWSNSEPWIVNCGYDMAQAMLTQIIGVLSPKGAQVAENLISFEQSDYADVWQAGMSNRGWIYLPRYCVSKVCSVHVALHDCHQGYDEIGNIFVKQTGLNEWAETNDFIIIYPQVIATQNNPHGCWDYWGYTGNNFAYQSGLQIAAVHSIAQKPPYVTWA